MTLEVLIIDDDEIDLFILETFIKKSGLSQNPSCFLNGKHAMDHLMQKPGHAETEYLIFLDINMPMMNGWQFLNEVNKTDLAGKVHVIVISSSTDAKDKEKSKKYTNVIELLEKPINMKACEQIKAAPQIAAYFEK